MSRLLFINLGLGLFRKSLSCVGDSLGTAANKRQVQQKRVEVIQGKIKRQQHLITVTINANYSAATTKALIRMHEDEIRKLECELKYL